MKPQKQTVYLPVNGDYLTAVCHFEYTEWCHYETVQSKEGYFFTPDQLNEYTKNLIKQALETAAENADIIYEKDVDWVDKQSITNTFNETFEKFKI